ncbi:hypothetical protein WMY93_009498 [Mugilogobius chulae]|uniref:G protein-regulated inducer of neurite outgrowth C-terminal domain-containing protein n=1 Tax=Mugilogobius chulae TaxID=88201 RepID=A0AAW0PD15_9GOBI
MGTLKDEMRGVSEDRLLGEKAEDGEDPGSSDGSTVTDALQKNTGVESTQLANEPKMDYNDDDICKKPGATKNMEKQSNSVAVPSTPDPLDPRSPAPFGQHHMRTQVSLEVVQCQSAATSPMTPPEGGHNSSFFFPCSFGRSEAVGTDTKDAELQVGQQVEYSSVATSPMTPKTPFFSTFPPLQSRESAQKKSEDSQGCQAESEISGALKSGSSKELKSEDLGCSGVPVSSANYPAVMSAEGKQQRMGSMDQDITILVTQHGNAEEDEDKAHSKVQGPVETEMVKLMEEEEDQSKNESSDQKMSKDKMESEEEKTELKSSRSLEAQDSKDMVPESPAPFGCHNMRTQVSLEVVQCHSAATSPMTPPEGDQAFCFPSVSSKCGETKDAELQVGQQVEYRSVATAPMTPRTPVATTFPEITKCASIEEKIVEEEEEKQKDGDAKDETESEESEEGSEGSEGGNENQTDEEAKQQEDNKEEKSEEPVQEVSWDEKGMTWEVYGAVVEVSVLGSAIQKHLEKQVKKQKQTLPPPPPLNPSATPLSPLEASPRATGSGKSRGKRGEKSNRRRRNPFRQMMENIQQPHCCSRAHTTE